MKNDARISKLDRNLRRLALAGFAAVGAISPGTQCVAGDVTLGQYLSGECVTCHQLSGKSDGISSIVGWPESSFVAVLESYRNKERPNPVMRTIAAQLSDAEIAALASYFATISK